MLRISVAVLVILISVALVWWLAPDAPRTGATTPAAQTTPAVPVRPPEPEPKRAADEPVAAKRADPALPSPTSAPSPRSVLHGRLDDAVPRPIVDGHVRIRMLRADPASEREFDA